MTSARDWYEEQHPGLGADFVQSLEQVMALVGDLPEAFPGSTLKCNTDHTSTLLPRLPDVRRGILRALAARAPNQVGEPTRRDSA